MDKESLSGQLSFVDPNYDFLGNSLRYSIASEQNDKPDQGYENSIISAFIGTGFEQYKNVNINLGIEQVMMILEPIVQHLLLLKNKKELFQNWQLSMG